MPWFRCLIHGENFPGALAGVAGLAGFYTTRFVEATDPGDAEARAVAMLRADPRLAPPPGYEPTGRAQVFLEEIAELPRRSVPAQQPGYAWYSMEDDE